MSSAQFNSLFQPIPGVAPLTSSYQFMNTPTTGLVESQVFQGTGAATGLYAYAYQIAVNPVNDAPSGANATLTTLEDTSYTFSAADFGFSDPAEGDAFLAVKITTLPAAGTLTLTGSGPVSAGDFVSVADINGGKLVYAPAANGNGAAYATLTFQVLAH